MDTPVHDPGRFARAVELAFQENGVTRLGPTQFRVVGQDEPEYFVDLSVDPPCYCGDMQNRATKIRNNCKHVLAARLAMKDPTLDNSLMEFAYTQMKRNEELMQRTKRKKATTEEAA